MLTSNTSTSSNTRPRVRAGAILAVASTGVVVASATKSSGLGICASMAVAGFIWSLESIAAEITNRLDNHQPSKRHTKNLETQHQPPKFILHIASDFRLA